MITRRSLLSAALLGVGFTTRSHATEDIFEINHTKDEWIAKLTRDQFAVLRKEKTERPFSSPLNDEKRPGIYHCAGCANPLYDASAKFDSGTGWPSFWAALPGRTDTRPDRSLFFVRTEEHCARCGGHLGHVFDDGPQPTGLRHCINGVALTFLAAAAVD